MRKEEKTLSPFYINDIPYIEGKSSKEILFKSSAVSLGGYIRYNMQKTRNIVCVCSNNDDFMISTHGKPDVESIKSELISLFKTVGIVIQRTETQSIVGYCPVCKKTFTTNTEICDNVTKHHENQVYVKQIKHKQPIIIKIKEFYLV